jgi:hypothetical protein
MTEYKHANPESLDRVNELLDELDELYDALDDLDVKAGRVKSHMMDRSNRRIMALVEDHIERAMDILESMK